MGKITEFVIILDTDRQVFYSGETISGRLRLVVLHPVKFRGLTINFNGKAYCRWTEQHGSGDNRRTVTYTGKEDLFQFTTLLSGHPSSAPSSSTFDMPAGEHMFPFAFQLPANLPTSFEAHHGHIRYSLVGCIDKPWRFDHHTRRIISVNEVIDTNHPQFIGIVANAAEKVVGCLCCLAGPVSVNAQIDRQAYCPGETVYITAHCDNRSSRNMTAMKGKLVREVIYKARTKQKHERKTVATLEGPPIAPRQFADWTNQGLLIPGTVPTINSNIIKVSYHLKICIDIPMAVDLTAILPLVIGTVPFRSTYMNPSLPTAPIPQFLQNNVPPVPPNALGYPDMPPPAYAAAVQDASFVQTEDETSKKMHADAPFTPMYTYAYPHAPPH